MKVYLIRHTSVDVPRGVCYGQTDVPLRATFPEEAAQVKERLAGIKFDKIYASPLSRCTKLAKACGFDDYTPDDRLKEINFGEWEMQRFEDITDHRLQEWYDDYENVRATGGESFADQGARLKNFLDELKTRDFDTVAVFAHGGILANAMKMFMGMRIDEVFDKQAVYGAVIQIEI